MDKDTPAVAVCRSGARSLRAAATLQKLGFTKVASMAGGMIACRWVLILGGSVSR
ncbi:MAG: rhodanese-like domain-containing protein [Sandaracinaceae bacterium]